MDSKTLKHELKSLAKLGEAGDSYVSIQLDLSRARLVPRGDWTRPWLRALQANDVVLDPLVESRLRESVAQAIDAGSDSMAIFLDRHRHIIWSGAFGFPMEERVAVDSIPHLFGLVRGLDIFRRYLLIVARHDKLDMVTVDLGSFAGKESFSMEIADGRPCSEFSRTHLLHRLRQLRDNHFRAGATMLERMSSDRNPDLLVLVGNNGDVNRLRERINPDVRKRSLVLHRLSPRSPDGELIRLSNLAFRTWESAQSREAVQQLLSPSRGRSHALGIWETYIALKRDLVRKIVLSSGIQPIGMRERLTRMALLRDCDIETLVGSSELDPWGGAGGFLHAATRDAPLPAGQAASAEMAMA